MKDYYIAGRGSWLSLCQIELFRNKVLEVFPDLKMKVKIALTAGDKDQLKPLHLVEGENFFTEDIQECLRNGTADFAVHSMKDVSSLSFFKQNKYAIIDRDELHDIAIFNPEVLNKIEKNEPIVLGTSSPRRSLMATRFLKNHLPQSSTPVNIQAIPVRGNVEVRLQKLSENQFDGLILAVAGLNRLLKYGPSAEMVKHLLKDKKLMLLPLFECPPAVGQGAIVVEAMVENTGAVAVLDKIRDTNLTEAITRERVFGEQYGYGCSRQFGAFHLTKVELPFTYAAGVDQEGQPFEEWNYCEPLAEDDVKIFSAADHMKSFFLHRPIQADISEEHPVLFFSSHRTLDSIASKDFSQKKIWAAGTKTWRKLAMKGIWVQGCADALGLEYLESIWQRPLYNIFKKDVQIFTSSASAETWKSKGWLAIEMYDLIPNPGDEIKRAAQDADIFFWTSYQQYLVLKPFIKNNIRHFTLPGRTSEMFKRNNISVDLFPTIRAFNKWKLNNQKVKILKMV